MYQYEIRYRDIDFSIYFEDDQLTVYLEDKGKQKLVIEGKTFVLDNLQAFFNILDDVINAKMQEMQASLSPPPNSDSDDIPF